MQEDTKNQIDNTNPTTQSDPKNVQVSTGVKAGKKSRKKSRRRNSSYGTWFSGGTGSGR